MDWLRAGSTVKPFTGSESRIALQYPSLSGVPFFQHCRTLPGGRSGQVSEWLSAEYEVSSPCGVDTHPAGASVLTPKGSLQMSTCLIPLVSSGLCGSSAPAEHDLGRHLDPSHQLGDIWGACRQPINEKHASDANTSSCSALEEVNKVGFAVFGKIKFSLIFGFLLH